MASLRPTACRVLATPTLIRPIHPTRLLLPTSPAHTSTAVLAQGSTPNPVPTGRRISKMVPCRAMPSFPLHIPRLPLKPGRIRWEFEEIHLSNQLSLINMLKQVYSFVPIPGSTQHKRPRRRFEEIERMYKCGWNGCEKAYGTLNHLNAHVTMQSHGTKRTPEGSHGIFISIMAFAPSSRRAVR